MERKRVRKMIIVFPMFVVVLLLLILIVFPPIKEFYVFDNSAHSPIFEEPEEAAELFEEIVESFTCK